MAAVNGLTAALPFQRLPQEVGVLADPVHQSVVVRLHFQHLMEDGLGHRRREECEGSVGHQLGDRKDGTKIISACSFLFFSHESRSCCVCHFIIIFFFLPRQNTPTSQNHSTQKGMRGMKINIWPTNPCNYTAAL